MKGFAFVDFTEPNKLLPKFSKDAPKSRTVFPGYNYEGVCSN